MTDTRTVTEPAHRPTRRAASAAERMADIRAYGYIIRADTVERMAGVFAVGEIVEQAAKFAGADR